ncbi:tRNA pseudouridine(13) synthase TruD [sulfur-oxidizing endosymbiont of Gigantopelta aegis]|uniref:tRNA pseudouridine(13) synthase TruD n=1 Tax=sulfur-oxidizing endosymbiont of Gigantopelta aegis TaxID=2794934 RepID=UPI0018DE7E73|nr:tRNA pseudouridine(13) synthase TruD [sulfur-oxidizing endosymbiont of Gigantopelta aegis]
MNEKKLTDTEIDLSSEYPLITVEELCYAHSDQNGPQGKAKFKTEPADFIVRETLSFEPEGEGTHAYLYIEKTNTNTEWLARQLARFVGVEAKEIGYAGLKDRNGVTSQWFSINLEIIDVPPIWDDFQLDGVKILINTLHRKKLKRGAIKHNSFEITLRDIENTSAEALKNKIALIQSTGVPNYFAQQRFGHGYGNLLRGAKWFKGIHKVKKRADKSMIISAARSMLFNQMLSQRMLKFGWNTLIDGEIMMLAGTHSIFSASVVDDEIRSRFVQGDIHPTIALWGRGRLNSEKEVLSMEQKVADSLSNWCDGLEHQGLKQERRAARLFPDNITITFNDNKSDSLSEESIEKAVLSFSLPTGTYATAVLREIIQF